MSYPVTTGIDAAAFAAVEVTAFAKPWRANQFQAGPPYFGLSIQAQDVCQAFVYAMLVAGEAEILRIACRPEYRRRGLAAALVEALDARCRTEEITRLFLEVATDNQGAVTFYRDRGFTDIGHRKNYYGTGCDALLMARSIPAISP